MTTDSFFSSAIHLCGVAVRASRFHFASLLALPDTPTLPANIGSIPVSFTSSSRPRSDQVHQWLS